MTVIVMLILAGVSLNALVGDNGIITNAQNATIRSSCASLQEFLQQEYVKISDINDLASPLENLLGSSKAKYFQTAKNNNKYFLDPITFNKCYFINKSALPKEIQMNLIGGDRQIDGIYAEYIDVYGVNQYLEVYYISDGQHSVYGSIEENVLDSTQIALKQSTDAKLIEQLGFDRDMSYRDIAGVTNVTITDNDISFDKFYMFNGLQKIKFSNVTLNSLDGISDAKNINFILFQNCDIKNYRGMAECANLTELYLYMTSSIDQDTANNQVKNLCSTSIGVGDIDFPKLKYMGVMGFDVSVWPDKFDASMYRISGGKNYLTDISPLESFYSGKYVQYMYLTNTRITSIESLAGFEKIFLLDVQNTTLVDLDGLENHTSLKYVFFRNSSVSNIEGLEGCSSLGAIHGENSTNLTSLYGLDVTSINTIVLSDCSIGLNDEDALESLSNAKVLNKLSLSNNQISNVDDLENVTSIKYLYLWGNDNLSGVSLKKLKSIIDKCIEYSIPNSLALALLDGSTVELNISSQTLTEANFESLTGMTSIQKLNLANVDLVANDNSTLTASEKEEIFDTVLESLTGMRYLSLEGLSCITHISFVESMSELREINLKNTNATTGTTVSITDPISGETITKNTGLELLNNLTKCCALAITNSTIDLSKIVPTLNRMKLGYNANTHKYTSGALCISNSINMSSLNKAGIGLTSLAIYGSSKSNIDLSLCTSLLKVSTCYSSLSGIIWPDTVNYWYNDNCGNCCEKPPSGLNWYYQHIGGQTMFNRMAVYCPNLTYFSTGSSDAWDFSDMSNAVFKDSLVTLIISDSAVHFNYAIRNVLHPEGLAYLSKLENLNISYTNISSISSFANGLSNLKTISARNTYLSTFEGFEKLSNITEIYVSTCSLSSLHYLEGLNNLVKLDISQNSLEDVIQYNETYIENGEKRTRLVTVYNLDILNNLNINHSLKFLWLKSSTNSLTTISRLTGTYTEKDF